jgi:hypothetical protein
VVEAMAEEVEAMDLVAEEEPAATTAWCRRWR